MPGQAPPHVILGVVHGIRRERQLTHSIYEEIAIKVRSYGGDIVVHTIVGDDDPLREGYTMWVLGIAARSTGSATTSDTLRACNNCLVRWRFDASESGTSDVTKIELLEKKAFATSRLKLARNGYYLLSSTDSLPAVLDSRSEVVEPPLTLAFRISQATEESSRSLLSFAWQMTSTETGATIAQFAHALPIPRRSQYDFMGEKQSTTHNALSAVYSRLPSHYEDSDGDGVTDSRDLEQNTPLGFQVDYRGRTLDSDGDGRANSIDEQPFTIPKYRLMVGPTGVPLVHYDADYDGVPDFEDQCADTNVRYVVDEHGCPVKVPEITGVLVDRGVLRERRISFLTGEATLLDWSKARLDSLGLALSDLPELRFNVDGHCDDRGSVDFNQVLSENRAAAVVHYLVDNFPGLKLDQFTSRGFGKSRPVLDEPTDAARELNRRVEIMVQNPEDAVRHVEGTRYLLRDEAIDGYQFEAPAGG